MKRKVREKIKALCVDDEEELLEIMKVFLESEGKIEVICETSPVQALQMIEKDDFDVVISDYIMPEMNGLELLRKIRSFSAKIPFIIFTGRGREEVVIEAINCGADGYLQKGGDPRSQFAELSRMIKTLVEKSRAMEALEVSERMLAEAQRLGRIGNFVYDVSKDELSVSDNLLRLLGIDEGLFDGKYETLVKHVHPEDRGLVIRRLSESALSSEECEIRYRVVLKGEERIVQHRTATIMNEIGEPVKVIGVIRDVTEEAGLVSRLEKLNTMFFAMRRINQLIAREKEENALLSTVCNDLVKTCLFESVIISILKGTKGRSLYSSCLAGDKHAELPTEAIYEQEPACVREALAACDLVIVNDGDPRCIGCPYSPRNDFVCLSKKIEHEGEVFGSISIHMRNHAYLDEEIEFISDLAGDLGFAMYRFKLEEAKKAVEETLMRSERRYRHFFERANDGFAILQEGIVKYANNRLLSMGGYQEKDVIGKHFSEFIADEDKMRTLEYYRKRVAGENVPSIYEVKLKKKDGNLIWAELNAAVAENEAGLATYVIIRDITEKVRMRELLEESEWKYRMLFETSGTAMLIIEEDMTVSLVNGEFTRLTGYSREEIEGKMKTYQLVAEKEVERITEYHRRRREGRSDVPRSYELELKRKDGSIRMVKITIDVIPGTKRSVASLVDITEERQLKEILKKEKELYEMLLDSVDTMIWTANDPETYGEIVNRARMEFLGLSRERIANRKIYEFLPKPEAEVGVKGNRIVFEEKRKYRDFEWVTNAKGEKRLMLVTKIPKFGKNGNVEFAACTAEDVTELKKVQDALALANKKLHLLGSVTRHDIMNQLTVISGSLQLLSDAIQDEKQRRFLSMALRAASNIERHLDFSRDYEKMGANPPQWINLSKIISKA
ncbi:MAG: PAS domain S-box protein, partial [Methanomassiliicoccales archaeon]